MTGFLDHFLSFLLSFGILGVAILSFLDSTIFFYLPFALDALLIILISKHRDWMPIYILATMAGSILGCALTFVMMRKASKETIEKKVSKRKLKRVKKKVERGGFFGLVVASLIPPPFPFTPFVVAAAISDLSAKKTFAAIITGRTIRYFALGFLSLLIGGQVLRVLESPIFKMFMLGLFVLAIVGTALSIYKWVKK